MKNVEKLGKNHEKCRKIIKNVEKLEQNKKKYLKKTGKKPSKMSKNHQK